MQRGSGEVNSRIRWGKPVCAAHLSLRQEPVSVPLSFKVAQFGTRIKKRIMSQRVRCRLVFVTVKRGVGLLILYLPLLLWWDYFVMQLKLRLTLSFSSPLWLRICLLKILVSTLNLFLFNCYFWKSSWKLVWSVNSYLSTSAQSE